MRLASVLTSSVAACLVVSLSACTPPAVVKTPTFKLQSIYLKSLKLQPPTAELELNIAVTNPNPVPLKMAYISSDLFVNGRKLAQLGLPNLNVPAMGQTVQPVKMNVPLNLDIVDTMLKVGRGQAINYRLDGQFTADLGVLGSPTFGPFVLAQGIWKQERILPF